MNQDKVKMLLNKDPVDGIFTFDQWPIRVSESQQKAVSDQARYKRNLTFVKIMFVLVIVIQTVALVRIANNRYRLSHRYPDCYLYNNSDHIPLYISQQTLYTKSREGDIADINMEGHLRSLQYPYTLLVPEYQSFEYKLGPSGVKFFRLKSSCVTMNIVVLPDGLGFIGLQDAHKLGELGFYERSIARTNSFFFEQQEMYDETRITIRPLKDLKFNANMEFFYTIMITIPHGKKY